MLYIVVAMFNGVLNIFNKLVNFEAKKCLGMGNGTLINYAEGSIIALVLSLILGSTGILNPGYLKGIPIYLFLGGVAGLAAMLTQLKGMSGVSLGTATILMLIGQLGAGFVIDSLTAGYLDVKKLIGLCLISLGIYIEQSKKNKSGS